MANIVIGHNPAANMLPMFYFLDQTDPTLEFITDVPTGHNRLLAEGKIDMAPISAFSFGEHWRNYSVLADLSVSAKGRIRSILLYSKFELTELDGKTIALTSASASSVNLLKIILHKFYGVKPTYVTMPPQIHEMLGQADAALLIGDEALMGLGVNTGCKVYDLSDEWLKHTGLPMTFSVWAVRNSIIENFPQSVANVHAKLLESKKLGLENINKIVDRCITELGNDSFFWESYFSLLRYDLTPELLKGLNTYFAYCVELGLLPDQPEIRIFA
ncbi:MAG TPA: menaquinone biosynthesis protein [Candidatus Deferrimicrobium sp.]|nr:menaquinone biosynthesis protein [Candidatus Deferrimicrobium sp.]